MIVHAEALDADVGRRRQSLNHPAADGRPRDPREVRPTQHDPIDESIADLHMSRAWQMAGDHRYGASCFRDAADVHRAARAVLRSEVNRSGVYGEARVSQSLNGRQMLRRSAVLRNALNRSGSGAGPINVVLIER